MKDVPFLDLTLRPPALQASIDLAVDRVLRSKRFVLGPENEALEFELARHEGTRHCVLVGSGLDALTFLLLAYGIGEGDEVIVPSHTFIATWLAIRHCGARPVPVEPTPGSYLMDPAGVAAAITPRTAAIVPVHLYGSSENLSEVSRVAHAHGIPLLADAAQSLGGLQGDARVTSLSDGAATSFYPGKNLGAMGDGGAVFTNDPDIATEVRKLRNYGSLVKYSHLGDGWNSRLDEIQAAVLRAKLPYLDDWNAHRRRAAALYLNALDGANVQLPLPDEQSTWHLFVIRSEGRDALQDMLGRRGVETLIHYPTTPSQTPPFANTTSPTPAAQAICESVLSLPLGPHLNDEDLAYVVEAVTECSWQLGPHS